MFLSLDFGQRLLVSFVDVTELETHFLAFCLSLGLGQRLWQVLVMSQIAFELSFNKNFLKWQNLTVFADKMTLGVCQIDFGCWKN